MFKRFLPAAIALACILMVARGGEPAKVAFAKALPPNVMFASGATQQTKSINLVVGGRVVRFGQTAASLDIQAAPAALDNPKQPGQQTAPQSLAITVTAQGLAELRRLHRNSGSMNTVTVTIYGPAGAVSPTSQTVALNNNTAVAQFTYNGTYFSTPLTVSAVLGNGSMTAPVFLQNKLRCQYGAGQPAYEVAETDPLMFGGSGGYHINASLGGGTMVKGVQLDTGSTGFLIDATVLESAPAANVVGPGQIGFETLEPSGRTYVGHYWLASVGLFSPGSSQSIDQTIPMEVLGVEFICVPGSQCQTASGVALMGVGFGRPTPPPGQEYLKTPLENAFLQLQDAVEGNLHSGYILATDHLWLGLNQQATSTFPSTSFTQLKKFKQRPGDWQGVPACLTFNSQTPQCGSMLLDIGIDSMIASGFNTPSPLNLIAVQAPNASTPSLSYSFPFPVAQNATPPAPDPNGIGPGVAIQFDNPPNSQATPFVNTGRDAIAAADYLYDADCGRVAFGPPTL